MIGGRWRGERGEGKGEGEKRGFWLKEWERDGGGGGEGRDEERVRSRSGEEVGEEDGGNRIITIYHFIPTFTILSQFPSIPPFPFLFPTIYTLLNLPLKYIISTFSRHLSQTHSSPTPLSPIYLDIQPSYCTLFKPAISHTYPSHFCQLVFQPYSTHQPLIPW